MRRRATSDGDVHLDEKITKLAGEAVLAWVQAEGQIRRRLGDFNRLTGNGIRNANQAGDGLPFERLELLELGRHDALLPLLNSRHRKCGGRDISWLGLQATERRSVKHATAAGIGFAHHDKLPLRRGHARVGIQLEETFISPGGNGHLPERRNPWWRPHHDNPNGSGETWLALGNDLKVIDAVLDERNLRRDDL